MDSIRVSGECPWQPRTPVTLREAYGLAAQEEDVHPLLHNSFVILSDTFGHLCEAVYCPTSDSHIKRVHIKGLFLPQQKQYFFILFAIHQRFPISLFEREEAAALY